MPGGSLALFLGRLETVVDWGDEGTYMAPNKHARIAAHRAPKVRWRDRALVAAFAVRMAVWACWTYNRRLFWELVLALVGFAVIAGGVVSLVIGALLNG